jgi:hypothetical protein
VDDLGFELSQYTAQADAGKPAIEFNYFDARVEMVAYRCTACTTMIAAQGEGDIMLIDAGVAHLGRSALGAGKAARKKCVKNTHVVLFG